MDRYKDAEAAVARTEILRDGEVVATVETREVLAWFHRHTPVSMDWAIRYEGYSVREVAS